MNRKKLCMLVLFLGYMPSLQAACSISDVVIKTARARVEMTGKRTYVKGVAVLTNLCADAIGIQVQMTAYDKAGEPVDTHQFWPASISNISPGDYTFTLDGALGHTPSMKTFSVEVARVKRW